MPEALVASASFDTVVANILAQPLIDLAEQLMASLKPGGHVLLSGIMVGQRGLGQSRIREAASLSPRGSSMVGLVLLPKSQVSL